MTVAANLRVYEQPEQRLLPAKPVLRYRRNASAPHDRLLFLAATLVASIMGLCHIWKHQFTKEEICPGLWSGQSALGVRRRCGWRSALATANSCVTWLPDIRRPTSWASRFRTPLCA